MLATLQDVAEIPAAQFHYEQAVIVVQVCGKNFGDRRRTPTYRHVGVSSPERYLVGLLFFIVVDRLAEVIVYMGVGDICARCLPRVRCRS